MTYSHDDKGNLSQEMLASDLLARLKSSKKEIETTRRKSRAALQQRGP